MLTNDTTLTGVFQPHYCECGRCAGTLDKDNNWVCQDHVRPQHARRSWFDRFR